MVRTTSDASPVPPQDGKSPPQAGSGHAAGVVASPPFSAVPVAPGLIQPRTEAAVASGDGPTPMNTTPTMLPGGDATPMVTSDAALGRDQSEGDAFAKAQTLLNQGEGLIRADAYPEHITAALKAASGGGAEREGGIAPAGVPVIPGLPPPHLLQHQMRTNGQAAAAAAGGAGAGPASVPTDASPMDAAPSPARRRSKRKTKKKKMDDEIVATGPVGRPRWSGPRGKRGGKGKNKIAKAAGVALVAKVKSSSSKKKRAKVKAEEISITRGAAPASTVGVGGGPLPGTVTDDNAELRRPVYTSTGELLVDKELTRLCSELADPAEKRTRTSLIGLSEDEISKRRRARNRVAAQQSRLRKRIRLVQLTALLSAEEDIEDQVAAEANAARVERDRLRAEMAQVRALLQANAAGDTAITSFFGAAPSDLISGRVGGQGGEAGNAGNACFCLVLADNGEADVEFCAACASRSRA